MKRSLAILAGLAVAAGGTVLGAAPAHAALAYTTDVSGIGVTWDGSTIRASFHYSTYEYGKVDLLVNGVLAGTKVLPEYDYASTSVAAASTATHGAAQITLQTTSCNDSDPTSAYATCETVTTFSTTVLPVTKAPAGKVSAVTLLNGLTVKNEAHASAYKRTKFGGWVDRDKDGENTRAEVLKSESKRTASVNKYGTVKGGKWISAYDNKVFTNTSRMDVDHMVPLAEAWASGAWDWSAKKRTAYANDLGYGSSLIAVSLSSNRSKGDKDPAEWVPTAKSDVCTYVKQFIAVKSRWHLSIDKTEKAAMSDYLANCSNLFIAKPAKPNVASLLPKPKLKPGKHTTSGSGSTSTHGLDPNYGTCTELLKHPNHAPYVRGVDPEYNWYQDRDGDGLVCE